MTNENLQANSQDPKKLPFGARLQTAREALGLERKDVASQLRLNEKIIVMMEKDRYPVDLPITFIRGYLRSYAKFLQIPDQEIKKGIEPIKPKASSSPATIDLMTSSNPDERIPKSNLFIQFVTYLVAFTLLGLAFIWWYTHTSFYNSPSKKTAASADTFKNVDSLKPVISDPSVVSEPSSVASAPINESYSENADDEDEGVEQVNPINSSPKTTPIAPSRKEKPETVQKDSPPPTKTVVPAPPTGGHLNIESNNSTDVKPVSVSPDEITV